MKNVLNNDRQQDNNFAFLQNCKRELVMLFRLFVVAIISFYAAITSAHQSIDGQIERVNTLLKKTPDNRELYIQRGDLHRQHSEWQLALKDFQTAEKINNTSGDTNLYKGRMRLEMNQAQKAMPLFLLFTRQYPHHSVALQYRGDTHFALQQFLSAAFDFKLAIAYQKPPDPELFLKLAHAYMAAGSNHRKDARAAIELGIDKLGPLVTLVTIGIELETEQWKYQEALALFDRLPKVLRSSPKWLARRGDILLKSGHKKEAIEVYSQVVSKIESLPLSRRNTREMRWLIKKIKTNQNQTIYNTERSFNNVKHL